MAGMMEDRQAAGSKAYAVWSAHKQRKQIAHEQNVQISDDMAKRVLASFKQALRDLGAM